SSWDPRSSRTSKRSTPRSTGLPSPCRLDSCFFGWVVRGRSLPPLFFPIPVGSDQSVRPPSGALTSPSHHALLEMIRVDQPRHLPLAPSHFSSPCVDAALLWSIIPSFAT